MSLAPGVRLGAYEILAAIGAGGMGEVYRARDTKLDREVAIKVLPDAFVADPERIARFQREAKTLASLNHPHIAAIYGFEDAGGVNALVLELVEGPTLADRIEQGAIPIDEALAIGRQIADALEAAHEQGIIHRDLKPANIKLRPDGAVKVLDFGLAKAFAADASSASNLTLTNSPTLTSPIAMSGVGVLLGTAAYMAPEQARGKPVDKRADIWAFGCVLYEMLSGRPPFAGSDVSELLAGVIKSEPAWERLPTDLSPALRNVLIRCLHKDPKQRLRDIGDVRLALDGAFESNARVADPRVVRQTRSTWQKAALTAGAVVLLFVTTGFAVWTLSSSGSIEPLRVRRVAINVSAPNSYNGQGIAISPDGTRVVYSATIDTRFQLYQRSLEQLEAQPLPGTESARQPFFSPDGQWIAFFSDGGGGGSQGKLQKISTRGGPPQLLCAAPFARGGWWSQDGTIIFASGTTLLQPSLFRVSANGGTPKPVEETKTGQLRGWPQTLSGGKRVLFTAYTGASSRLEVLSLETGESRVIVENGRYGRYIPTGHLVYMSDARLLAAPFDIDRLETTGPAVALIEGVRTVAPTGMTSMAIADDGTLVYQPGGLNQQQLQGGGLVVVSRDGRATAVNATRHSDIWPRLSPDESQVAVFTIDPTVSNTLNSDVWVYDLRRGTRDRITTDVSEDSYPVWTPDGLRMVFLSTRTGTGDLYSQPLDKSKGSEPLVKGETRKVPNSFSPDGKVLAFYEVTARNLRDIWMLPAGGKPEPFIATPADELAAVFSPDGKWIAYVSDESGARQVYAQPYPGPGRRIPISTDGGEGPVWSRDGQELFYFKPQTRQSGQMLSVDVKAGPALASVPRVVFEGPFVAQANGNANYDVFRDGRRFIMIQEPKESTAVESPLVVVLNWFEELKRLAPKN